MTGLVALAAAIGAGRTSAVAAVSAALARAAAVSDLNAVVAVEPEDALAEAAACDAELAGGKRRGPLHGVPLAHKDMFYREGRISGCGSRIRRDFVAASTSPLIERLERAGAITIGRLHMAEFAMGPTGHNAHLGRCRNPWNAEAITGGSSSGSGAAVAAQIVPAALGSDTGGSVRLPAAFCGVAGLKPTQWLLPATGMMPLSESLDNAGPLASSCKDLALLMSVLTDGAEDYAAGLGMPLARLTIGIPTTYYVDSLDRAVADALAEARRVFEQLGARLVDVAVPDGARHAALAARIWAPEAASLHLDWLRSRPEDYGDQVRNRLAAGLAMPATDYLRARRERAGALREMLAGPLAACDILLTPAARMMVPLAREVDSAGGEAMERMIGDLSALTRTISALGLPALVTTMGVDPRGLPIGMQLVGRPHTEALLLAIGDAYERRTTWTDRKLPI